MTDLEKCYNPFLKLFSTCVSYLHRQMAGRKGKKLVEKAPGSASKDALNKDGGSSKCVVEGDGKVAPQQVQEDICKFCKVVFVNEDDPMVICERCEDYVCISCANLSTEEYSFLQRTQLVHWFCQACEKPALSAVKSEKLVEEKCSAMFAAFRAEMEDTYRKELSLLRNELLEMKAQLNKAEKIDMEAKGHKEVISEITSESSRELLERDRRKCNLVWFGVPECTSSETSERVAADTAFVVDCCSKALSVSVDITSCKRLRSKDAAATTCKPLLVTVKDPAQVGLVLKAARKLRDSAEFKSVFVKKDSTPLERTELRKKLQERDRRRSEEKSKDSQSQVAKVTPAAAGQPEESKDK